MQEGAGDRAGNAKEQTIHKDRMKARTAHSKGWRAARKIEQEMRKDRRM